jgi:hypothetical protein
MENTQTPHERAWKLAQEMIARNLDIVDKAATK